MNDPEKDIEMGPGNWDEPPTKTMTNAALETRVGELEQKFTGLQKEIKDLGKKVDECILDSRTAIQLMREAMASFSVAMPKLEQAIALLSVVRDAKAPQGG